MYNLYSQIISVNASLRELVITQLLLESRLGECLVKFSCPVAQAPNARLGHIHASMAATLALRICAKILNIRYINARRVSPSNGKMRLFFISIFGIKGTPLTSTGHKL